LACSRVVRLFGGADWQMAFARENGVHLDSPSPNFTGKQGY
jgi:hypothetical protein